MLSKNEVKFIQSLCHKKKRQEEGLFIAEGVKLVEEIIQSDYRVKKIFATDKWQSANRAINEITTLVSEGELVRISGLQTPNQVLAIVHQHILTEMPQLEGKLTLVLDGIQDPGNMGTIIRIADWFGINQIICSHNTVELYNPKVIQGTMGSFLRVKVLYENLSEILNNIKVPVFGALLDGESVYDIQKPNEGIILIGNEGQGISKDLLPLISRPITIPKIGGAESLNAAVATGIILSHLVVVSF